jgi:hypothetical protein
LDYWLFLLQQNQPPFLNPRSLDICLFILSIDARKSYVVQSLPETLKTAFNSLPASHKKAVILKKV